MSEVRVRALAVYQPSVALTAAFVNGPILIDANQFRLITMLCTYTGIVGMALSRPQFRLIWLDETSPTPLEFIDTRGSTTLGTIELDDIDCNASLSVAGAVTIRFCLRLLNPAGFSRMIIAFRQAGDAANFGSLTMIVGAVQGP